MKVRDVMTPLVESVHPDDTLRQAAEKMKALDLDPIPVTEGDRLVGTLSDNQVSDTAAREGLGTGGHPVREAMSQEYTCCSADEDVHEAVERLGKERQQSPFSRLPVVDASGELVGLVTVQALVKRLTEEEPGEGVAAVLGVESVASLINYDEDSVDFMSDESFPASDPMPPPSTLGPGD